jgi:RHS repeat-associated protein
LGGAPFGVWFFKRCGFSVNLMQHTTPHSTDSNVPKFENRQNNSYYRARYYDPTAGRFVSEDPITFRGGANFYRYVKNSPVNLADPMGLYQLKGFTPGDAANMILTINQLTAKLKSSPCCVDPKLRDRILNLLGGPNDGSGVTFVYHRELPADPGHVTCATSLGGWAFLTNRIEIADAAFANPACGCLPSTILHEVNHLTWSNRFSPDPEGGSLDVERKCFPGGKC